MQETSIAFFSHRLETLIEYFIRNIYCHQTSPFSKRMVVIPHISMKSYLLQNLSQHLGIAAGLKIVTLSQAVSAIFEEKKIFFPKFLELSLSIQHEILSLLENKTEVTLPLFNYLDSPSSSLRIAQLSDLLSLTFLDYSEYGGAFLEPWLQTAGWQQELWKKIFSASSSWTFHYKQLLQIVSSPYSLHLFGFHFIPDLYLNFFKKMGSSFYLFSPCQSFWADRYSQKEIIYMQKTVSFEEQNPLLANLGKLGRRFFTSVLDQDLNLNEDYPCSSDGLLLQTVQRSILEDLPLPKESEDESIQIRSTSSKLREIEVLYDTLVSHLEKNSLEPHEIAVFAPDISAYAPFIQAVFSKSSMTYSISNLQQCSLSPLMQAFKQLLELPNEKFSKEAVLKLFASLPFKEKFHLSSEDILSIQSWVEQSGVRWGLDAEQRRQLLFQEAALEDGQMGTWEMGVDWLLWGIVRIENGLIQLSEMELFNKLLCILRSLKEDLKPLFDGTKQKIPEWISYFEKLIRSYFKDDSGEMIGELSSLRATVSHLNRNLVDYEAIKRAVFSLFEKKSATLQESHLHGVKFYSITPGAIFPAKIIYLIGMQEGAFPRKNRKRFDAPEFEKKGDFHPKQVDQDRFSFLQLLLSARNVLFLSYQRISEEDQKPLRPSILIEELQSHLNLTITHYSAPVFNEIVSSPLLPELYVPTKMELQYKDMTINVEKLASFARHPLRFYFREVLQMAIDPFQKNEEEEEFILSPLFKKTLREKSFVQPLDQLLSETESRGALPRGLFKKIALQTMRTEVESLDVHLRDFGFAKEEVGSEEIKLQVILKSGGAATIQGKLEGICPAGFLFHGENEISDLVKVWPLFLIYLNCIKECRPTILFSKSGESRSFVLKDPALSLQCYLEYYQLASQYASPLIPQLGKSLLKGSPEELEKKIEELIFSGFSYQDKVLKWLFDRDKTPSSSAIFLNWVPILKETHDF
ncbi:MAG TPA: exodeoxyribonuclease V subunit gamma [Rhabdochlamydiaceae bacterium]|nr:exodeoxyribonuclease V subunit gamma [Rhabdochlamydiaceae bacterium]